MTRKEKINALDKFCESMMGECTRCALGWMCEAGRDNATEDVLNRAIMIADIASTPEKSFDMVNKASHYQLPGGLECWDVMVAMFGAEQVRIWCKLNAFTYLFRCDKKNGEEDIRKALVNLEKYFELEDSE